MSALLPPSLAPPGHASSHAAQAAQQLFQLLHQMRQRLEKLDGHRFVQDPWQRPAGGGGLSCVLEQGQLFEKAGVLFSSVHGEKLPPSTLMPADAQQQPPAPFFAVGVSLILHPHNPYVPATHLNLRYFEVGDCWWFGGGMDLTPCYPFKEDCIRFHQAAKSACDTFDPDWHPRFKRWCDEYFYLPHRKEQRGVGGIFFNHLRPAKHQRGLDFLMAVAQAFLQAYPAIAAARQSLPYSQHQRNFLQYRRGRYAEFNLLYDQGTLFGLQSGGRVEAILMSLPPLVSWHYNWQTEDHSPESLMQHFLQPHDWASLKL